MHRVDARLEGRDRGRSRDGREARAVTARLPVVEVAKQPVLFVESGAAGVGGGRLDADDVPALAHALPLEEHRELAPVVLDEEREGRGHRRPRARAAG